MINNSKWFKRLCAGVALLMVAGVSGCDDDTVAAVVAALTCTDGQIMADQPVVGTVTITGCLNGDEDGTDDGQITLDSDSDPGIDQYLISGVVFVGNDTDQTILNIAAGTLIKGDTGAVPGTLVIRRNSRINAMGTSAKPIVMTSSQDPGSRAAGDWGGLVINGNAPINGCATAPCTAQGEGGTGTYGGSNAADNSGTLQYVRVEFAGKLFSPDNELNGIAFQGVGSGTTVSHIQVHRNADDGVEFFGGTVNAKYVLLTGIHDDSLDWTDGWIGNLQHVVAQQWDDSADQGIEADNNGENNTLTPMSLPTISNMTIISTGAGDQGILLREGTGAHLHNILLIDNGSNAWSEGCLNIDHADTFANSTVNNDGDLTMVNSVIDCTTAETGAEFIEDVGDGFDVSDWYNNGTGNQASGDLPVWDLMDPFSLTSPDFRITGGANDDDIDDEGMQPAGTFWDAVSHIGGMGADDWAAGWTTGAMN